MNGPQMWNTESLGGVGAAWAGEQQRAAMDQAAANEANTLEQIARSQQLRDITAQKTPFEIEKLKHEQSMFGIDRQTKEQALTKGQLDIDDKTEKMSREKYQEYLARLSGLPMDATLEDKLSWVNAANKDFKMDPENPMSMMAVRALQNPEQFKKLMDAVALGDPKFRQEQAKQDSVNATNLEQTRLQQEGQNTRNQATITAQNERSAAKQAAAQTATSVFQEILKASKGDPVKALGAIQLKIAEAMAAKNVDLVEALTILANDPRLVAAANNAQANRPANTVTPGGVARVGGTVPLPPVAAPAGARTSGGGTGSFGEVDPIQAAVEKAGKTYDPNKYEYRIGPRGEVQQKLKVQ